MKSLQSSPLRILMFLVLLIVFTMVVISYFFEQKHPNGKPKDGLYYEGAFKLNPPEGWYLHDAYENEQGVITLSLQKRNGPNGGAVTTYFPNNHFTKEEALVETKRLMKDSLYRIKEPLEKERQEIEEREMVLFTARAGEKETHLVKSALIKGKEEADQGHLLIILLAQEEERHYFMPYLDEIVNDVTLY